MSRKLISLNKVGEWRNQNPTLYQIIQEIPLRVNAFISAEESEVNAQIERPTTWAGSTRGRDVASASVITPTGQVFLVSGVTAIDTITIPFAGFCGTITIIPTGVFSLTTAGNIAVALAASVVSVPIRLTFDPVTNKWY